MKVYTAILNQSGTNPPVATVIQNTFGVILTWEYDGLGTYFVTLVGAFPIDKTFFRYKKSLRLAANPNFTEIQLERASDDEITLITITGSHTSNGPANDLLIDFPFELKVYP